MITNLVSDLPEVYQPIYGHPELSGKVSRPCQDRLEKIAKAHDALQRLLDRPLNVLDLGCAQGYFSLNLAERGAIVHGVDYLEKNIAVCNALAQSHPLLKVSFEAGRIEDAIARLEPGQYDLVLGLSVFHHLVYEKGVDVVKGLLNVAAHQSGALLVEFALHEEPLYWAPSLPQDPRLMLESIAFVHEVARHGTHLAPIPRPLFVASNHYWLLAGNAGSFDTWTTDPHILAHGVHGGSRRYYFSPDIVLKYYRFDHPGGKHNKSDFAREKQFLESSPIGFPAPARTIICENSTEGWLGMTRLPGKLLVNLLHDGANIDHRAVLLEVLRQLALLEAAGLYHDDVRTWNVLVAEDGAVHLIDYASISQKKQDCVWPWNPFLSFFIFVREVATGIVDDPSPLRTISISPFGLPRPYCAWATSIWHHSMAEWSFQLMHETLMKMTNNINGESLQQPIEAWMKATEEAIQAQTMFIRQAVHQTEAKAQQAEARAQQVEARAQQVEARAQQSEARAQQSEARAQQSEASAQQSEARAQQSEASAQQSEARAQQSEARAQQSEARAQQSEASAQQAEDKTQQAETRAQQAEDKTQQAETRAQQAEDKTQQAETRAQQAEDKTQQAETRAQQAEDKTQQAEARAQQAEAKMQQAEARAQQAEAKMQQAEARAQQAEDKTQQAEARAQQAEAKVYELNQSSHHWWLEAQRLNQVLQAVYDSTSWNITSPLRKLSQFVRRFSHLPFGLITWLVHLPKRIVRWFLVKAMAFAAKHPALRRPVSPLLKKFPKIDNKIRQLAMARGLLSSTSQYSPKSYSEVQEMLQASPQNYQLNQGGNLTDSVIDQTKRVVLFYVEHTAMFDRVTGVQRVCHKLSSSLANNINETIILVKLDAANLEICPLNPDELQKFVAFSGFRIGSGENRYYEPAFFKTLVSSLKDHPRKHWLVIPEVTYHSVHMPPPTSRLIKLARDYGLKVGVIFYDMIPLITGDASSNAQKHMNYISNISLADVIWPISHYASKGLIDYFVHHEKLSVSQFPAVSANPLPEEKDGARVMPNPHEVRRNILCLGTIDERKNQITLIKAFNEYCKSNRNTDWKLQIVGLVRDGYRRTIEKECLKNPNVELYYSASDIEIDSFFQNAAFTVFPSLEEGYGLPIVESLWHLRPCICANFGSMNELSLKGGCLTVDVRKVAELVTALSEMIHNQDIYKEKIKEILERNVKTWHEYAEFILGDMDRYQYGNRCSGLIYYWVDATLAASGNTGIQRVNRQLAKRLIKQGHRLVPLKWNDSLGVIDLATPEDLEYLEKWNGPDRNGWYKIFDLEKECEDASYLMVDLPLNRSLGVQQRVIDEFKSRHIKCAAIFYDAIPYKLADIYPVNFTNAHKEYMTMLDQMDSVFSISETSNSDLLAFLNTTSTRGLLLEQRLKSVALPAEFPVRKRSGSPMQQSSEICTILTVGTVEPRKNHIGLLAAFLAAEKQSQRKLKLVIVGSSDTFDHELSDKVEALVKQSKNIVWIKNANDKILEQQYYEADFTIFPSVEEGYGLPIVESLWFGCPCICANFGQMMELAASGGCLPVDVKDVEKFSEAILCLANDQVVYQKLKLQITRRYFKTWDDYASEVSSLIQKLHRNKKAEYRKGDGSVAKFKTPTRPLLSVCITTYERTDWLELNIENFIEVAKHLGRRVELIVCDNCSSTSVAEIFSKYQNHDQISFYRNGANIGMLGNLPQTVSLARGDYVWLIGDDDIIHQGSLEKIIDIIQTKEPELINLNYAYATDLKPPKKEDLKQYLKSATTICSGSNAHEGLVKEISCYNENFYTAIYSFVAKRSYAWRIYSQDTSGQPFSSLQTCVPTTKYILSNMMEARGYWESEPLITVNLNVSWGRYTPLWILERVPEVYDFAELNGIPTNEVDPWRKHTLQNTLTFLEMIYTSENPELYKQFDIIRFIRRYRHLSEFGKFFPRAEAIYEKAFEQKNPLATIPPEQLKGLCHG